MKKEKKASKVKQRENFLKEGDTVLYHTTYTVDKAIVEKLDKKTGIATLSNQVKVKINLSSEGEIKPIGLTQRDMVIKLWSDSVESEYNYLIAKRTLHKDLKELSDRVNDLSKEITDLSKEITISISKGVKRLLNKCKDG